MQASPHSPAHTNPAPRGPLVLIGGGGHAIVVAEAARVASPPHPIVGFLDDHPAAPLGAILIDLPHPHPAPACLGPLDAVPMIGDNGWVVALGDLRSRRASIKRMSLAGGRGRAVTVVHPTAIVSPSALIGPGTFIGPGAIVHARARVGPHCIINTGAIVEHDCVLDENAHIAPGAVLAGGVKVGHDSLVGLGSRVLPQVRIGHLSVVGAGAVVLGDVADGVTVVGVPASPLG
ncbi:MAG TPA: acetyltransferase [Phycisphaerales bacterium]|nr:acetyltransferase [Phycisphaerales bacterium]